MITSSQERLVSLAESILERAEQEEWALSYCGNLVSEESRRRSGSYYTPADVAVFFWNQFCEVLGIRDSDSALDFVSRYTFVEPSAGSGVLAFALIRKLYTLGVSAKSVSQICLRMFDINPDALAYINRQYRTLELATDQKFSNVTMHHRDFRDFRKNQADKPYLFFGNPPFVANPKGVSRWKNLYADFLEIALDQVGAVGRIHFILPLSIAFSRDYAAFRRRIRSERCDVFASHFDNIPDTLFKSGKPHSRNSNKANSQRCTILTVVPSGRAKLRSTMLHRWSTRERARLLTSTPSYLDVTQYQFDDQIFRPASHEIARYLVASKPAYRLGQLVSSEGQHKLHIASVARNYISVRPKAGAHVHSLRFSRKKDFYRCLGLIASDLFFAYWRSVGDGFHLTKSNIHRFPISAEIDIAIRKMLPKVEHVWSQRNEVQKSKRNAGQMHTSYDFSTELPSLIQELRHSGKRFEPKGVP